eukprot:1149234-Pelagomonas_calceolata.AAC.9
MVGSGCCHHTFLCSSFFGLDESGCLQAHVHAPGAKACLVQIMESLGGDQAWFDRFLAEHAAVLYYWVCIGFYLVSPKNAYNFMQRVEHHAADTYSECSSMCVGAGVGVGGCGCGCGYGWVWIRVWAAAASSRAKSEEVCMGVG